MRALVLAIALIFAAVPPPAFAVQPGEQLADRALETRARGLSRELRCMVCQNESIDESNAPLARDLRLLVRERLVAGDSDRQVLDFLVARYGDFVLLRPPLNASTIILWATPVVAVAIGVFVLVAVYRRRASSVAAASPEAALTADEEKRIAALLDKNTRP
jgi:cytochrome c-type biogenesis protein CcmH